MQTLRYRENPLITPKDVKPSIDTYEVLCAFNAGVAEYRGEIVLLMRVAERPVSDNPNKVLVPVVDFSTGNAVFRTLEFSRTQEGISLEDPRAVIFPEKTYLTSISHFRVARSRDGRQFTVDDKPALVADQPYEAYGIEDPRITRIGDTYYVVYKGVAPTGITQCLASTKDFVTWEKHGIILAPENMDAALFPEKIGGRYALLHRPVSEMFGAKSMWIAYSDDLKAWGGHRFIAGIDKNTWAGERIGAGAVPFLTDQGWLEIFHGASDEGHYCLGAMLLDKDNPERVIARSIEPIFEPESEYERHGFIPNVVFTCGALVNGDTITVYYGVCDEAMAAAEMSVKEILSCLR